MTKINLPFEKVQRKGLFHHFLLTDTYQAFHSYDKSVDYPEYLHLTLHTLTLELVDVYPLKEKKKSKKQLSKYIKYLYG